MYQQRWGLGAASAIQTVPSLARFGLLIPVPFIGGIGMRTALVALTLYGLPETRGRYERRIRGIMSMEALMHYDVTSRLHEIAAPTLVIWGRQDIRGELKEAERHAARLPREKCWCGRNAATFRIWRSRRSSTRW
jgi:pimeloyl-ACP methyl ester carboxylesterase